MIKINEQCVAKTIPGAQLVSTELETCGIVVLYKLKYIYYVGQNLENPCCVLDSGQVKRLCSATGTNNALTDFGFGVFCSNEVPIHPVSKDQPREKSSTLYIVLNKSVDLKSECIM